MEFDTNRSQVLQCWSTPKNFEGIIRTIYATCFHLFSTKLIVRHLELHAAEWCLGLYIITITIIIIIIIKRQFIRRSNMTRVRFSTTYDNLCQTAVKMPNHCTHLNKLYTHFYDSFHTHKSKNFCSYGRNILKKLISTTIVQRDNRLQQLLASIRLTVLFNFYFNVFGKFNINNAFLFWSKVTHSSVFILIDSQCRTLKRCVSTQLWLTKPKFHLLHYVTSRAIFSARFAAYFLPLLPYPSRGGGRAHYSRRLTDWFCQMLHTCSLSDAEWQDHRDTCLQ